MAELCHPAKKHELPPHEVPVLRPLTCGWVSNLSEPQLRLRQVGMIHLLRAAVRSWSGGSLVRWQSHSIPPGPTYLTCEKVRVQWNTQKSAAMPMTCCSLWHRRVPEVKVWFYLITGTMCVIQGPSQGSVNTQGRNPFLLQGSPWTGRCRGHRCTHGRGCRPASLEERVLPGGWPHI